MVKRKELTLNMILIDCDYPIANQVFDYDYLTALVNWLDGQK